MLVFRTNSQATSQPPLVCFSHSADHHSDKQRAQHAQHEFDTDTKQTNKTKIQIQMQTFVCVMSHPNPTSFHILQYDIFEKSLINWCQRFGKTNNNKNFLDIGAHMGTYSFALAPYFEKVYAFECQKQTYLQLCAGILFNNLCDQVTAYQCALTSPERAKQTHQATLQIVSPDGGGSCLENLVNQPVLKQETVIQHTLDSFQLKNIGFIKIDVEGHELQVLQGSIQTLKQSGWPPILLECWPDPVFAKHKQNLIDFLKQWKYQTRPVSNYPNMLLCTHCTHEEAEQAEEIEEVDVIDEIEEVEDNATCNTDEVAECD